VYAIQETRLTVSYTDINEGDTLNKDGIRAILEMLTGRKGIL
jgi:hypothetical protein